MPDKYREILSGSSAWLAIFAAAGGVLVNYIGVYKQTGRLHLRWLLGDLVTSCFLGYFAFWLLLDWGFAVSECAVGTAIVGNLGAKVFAIIKHFLSVRTGTPPHVLLEQTYDAYTRNPQSQSGEPPAQPREPMGRSKPDSERP